MTDIGLQDAPRASSPEQEDLVVLSKKEELGPSTEEDADFAKELAKLLSDTSDARKVDKRSALATLDASIVSGAGNGKKRGDDGEADTSNETSGGPGLMKFTLLSRRGNKQQVCSMHVPSGESLAHTIVH